MEKPIPPNPDTMTDEEFNKWLEKISRRILVTSVVS